MSVQVDYSFAELLFANPIFLGIVYFLITVFVLIMALMVVRFYIQKAGKVPAASKRTILWVTIPKEKDDDKGSNVITIQQVQEKIAVAETLYSTVAGLKAQSGLKTWFFGRDDIFSFEIVASKGKISFYIAVPVKLQRYVEEQIHAQYSNAFIEEIEDYNFFQPKCVIRSTILVFGKESFFPIKTYKKFDSDPLNSIVNALSKVREDDGAAVQIIMRPVDKSWRTFGVNVASNMQQGKKLGKAIKEAKSGFIAELFNDLKPKKDDAQQPDTYRLSPMEEEVVKGIEEKASKAAVEANIRIIVSANNKEELDEYSDNLANAFSQYDVYNYGNGFKPEKVKLKKVMHDFIYRNFDERKKMVFNTEELASLYHFPIPFVNETPTINWLESKKSPAPQNTPTEGIYLGENLYRGKKSSIFMKREDRVRHMYVIGMTGTGKTYFTSGMAMQDIAAGEGVCFIDPHGSDIEDILARVPKERAEDVIFFDPTDVERPLSLNMLEYDVNHPEQKTFVVNEVMNIFDKLYDLKATGGPMFEQYFKNAAYLILDDPDSGSTLMEIPKVLADEDFRRMKLSKCKTPTVKDFWEKEAQKAGGEASLQNMVPYITSKLAPFIANDLMRPIISQQKSSINFREAMDEGKIILVKLAKGKIGEINAHLLGMIIVTKIQMAALSRVDTARDQLRDFYLYIDEFQNVLTDSIESILSEARKYRLALIIAHQYIGQLVSHGETKFKDAIFGNVGTKVAFRIGMEDAELLSKEFEPVFSTTDFLNVPARNCFMKLLIDGANPPGFNMVTQSYDSLPGVGPANPELAKAIKELSRLKYGKDREIIEMEVASRKVEI
jgi:hypothetical protein